MFSMIDKPGRASISTSRPSLSVTTSLTMKRSAGSRPRGRDYIRRPRAAVAARPLAAGVVRIESAAAIGAFRGLQRGMPDSRFRGGIFGGVRVRVAAQCGFGSRTVLGGLAPLQNRDLLRRLERKVFVLEALQQHRSVLEDVLGPLPNAVTATVDDDLARSFGFGFGRRRLAGLDVLLVCAAHILSKGLSTLLDEASRGVFHAPRTCSHAAPARREARQEPPCASPGYLPRRRRRRATAACPASR